jgi:epoxyqueuosine reductase
MSDNAIDYIALAANIKQWGQDLGFAQVGITDVDLSVHEPALLSWLDNNYYGSMDYMSRHGLMRARPQELVPGTIRVISVRMNYLPTNAQFAVTLKKKDHAYISRYALGRDYHKLMRKRLKQLGNQIKSHCDELNFRPFVDSAPILERPLAQKAGLGWIGKHSLVINKNAGSWFFLGELLVSIPLPCDDDLTVERPQEQPQNLCGTCISCLKICPTGAIVEPYVVDAKRCISYLTIESKEAIPEALRPLIGNRIYGCDDCQLICPWNKFAPLSDEHDFQPRQNFDHISLLTLFAWSESQFLDNTEGSPIRRIGFQSWQRNIAVALGNADYSAEIVEVLILQLADSEPMVAEHITWALAEQIKKKKSIDIKPDANVENSINKIRDDSSQYQEVNKRLTGRLIRSIEKGLPRDA